MRKWFNNLRVSHKLALISIFFLMPDSVMLYFFVTGINAEIHFAQLEQLGTQYERPLESLLNLIPQHRLLALQALAGEAGAAARLQQTQTQIDAAFDALDS